MGGVFTKLIDRNTTIPVKKSQIFSTAADNQPSVEVHVLQGEREMAAGNKTLGRFQLDGIAPARRGVPQIEVTFDIDANGIVNVSAQDKGTGNEQHITITSSSNLSKDDIDRAVKEAEQYAAEDAKRKEDVDLRNNADQLIYQCDQAVKELGDKITPDELTKIDNAKKKLEEALKGTDSDAIKNASAELGDIFQGISARVYQETGAAGAAGAAGAGAAGAGAAGGSAADKKDFYDADYEVVDDDQQ